MKSLKTFLEMMGILVLLIVLVVAGTPSGRAMAAQVGEQTLISMKFINAGVQAQASGVLQTGQVSSLSAAVASGTDAQVVAATGAGLSTYIQAVVVEKSAGATGVVTVEYGTGTNCATGKTTIVTYTNPLQNTIPLGILVPAAKAVCLVTEGANTSARILYN